MNAVPADSISETDEKVNLLGEKKRKNARAGKMSYVLLLAGKTKRVPAMPGLLLTKARIPSRTSRTRAVCHKSEKDGAFL